MIKPNTKNAMLAVPLMNVSYVTKVADRFVSGMACPGTLYIEPSSPESLELYQALVFEVLQNSGRKENVDAEQLSLFHFQLQGPRRNWYEWRNSIAELIYAEWLRENSIPIQIFVSLTVSPDAIRCDLNSFMPGLYPDWSMPSKSFLNGATECLFSCIDAVSDKIKSCKTPDQASSLRMELHFGTDAGVFPRHPISGFSRFTLSGSSFSDTLVSNGPHISSFEVHHTITDVDHGARSYGDIKTGNSSAAKSLPEYYFSPEEATKLLTEATSTTRSELAEIRHSVIRGFERQGTNDPTSIANHINAVYEQLDLASPRIMMCEGPLQMMLFPTLVELCPQLLRIDEFKQRWQTVDNWLGYLEPTVECKLGSAIWRQAIDSFLKQNAELTHSPDSAVGKYIGREINEMFWNSLLLPFESSLAEHYTANELRAIFRELRTSWQRDITQIKESLSTWLPNNRTVSDDFRSFIQQTDRQLIDQLCAEINFESAFFRKCFERPPNLEKFSDAMKQRMMELYASKWQAPGQDITLAETIQMNRLERWWGIWNWFWYYSLEFLEDQTDKLLISSKESELRKNWKYLFENGFAYLFYEKVCFVCRLPSAFKTDTRGVFHAEHGPAISFADGFEIYAWKGLKVPPKIIREAFTGTDILRQENLELRRAMIDIYGFSKFMLDVGAQITHSDECGELYTFQLDNETMKMVKVLNSTIEPDGSRREYFLRVPPDTSTAKQGVAWTFSMDEAEYKPKIET